MGLPSINIIFANQARTSIKASGQGILAAIVNDSAALVQGGHELANTGQIPDGLGATNKEYIERAFVGAVNTPRKMYLYVQDTDDDYTDALAWLETKEWDYLVAPHDVEDTDVKTIAAWIKARRADKRQYKAVLPNVLSTDANDVGIINFTGSGIKVGTSTFSAAQYCSRMAGAIAGTPLSSSCTYVVLPEVEDITRYTRAKLDEKIDDGELVLYHDGEKVKIGRGVNSLTTVGPDQTEQYKKIKVIAIIDMITRDLRVQFEDNYVGKFGNSYDNKNLLITAVKSYFVSLENEGILEAGYSDVQIDVDAQSAYLSDQGIDVSSMSEDEIKAANTGDKVFLAATIRILDAIEDITLTITL